MSGNLYGGMELHYDMKRGFLLYSVTEFSSGVYTCIGKLSDKENNITYELIILRKGNLDVF